jgi:hypothetical protein
LHVLGTPPAFVLSQDQTLQKEVDLLKICLLSSSGSQRLVENNLPPSTCKHASSEEHFPSALSARLRFSMWTLRFVQFSKNINNNNKSSIT